MRRVPLWIGVVLTATAPATQARSQPPSRPPNVIVIVTDDQGSIDARCYGSTDLQTPALDALAKRGVRFTQFYAAAPVCSSSRAGLMTGRYPLRAGVPNNVSSTRGDAGMPASQATIAEMLRDAGYATAHVGKWHLGYTPETMPGNQGFNQTFGHMGGCIDNYSHFFYWQGPNRHDLWRDGVEVHQPGRFFPDLMLEEASRFIEANRDRPFFLYFAMNQPHYPYQAEPAWLERMAALPYPRNLYAAFVATLDERIGRLVAKVDALGLRERTLIVYQSDNGHSTEERAHFGGGSAGPYRGQKFSLFEGGIRVPAVVSWPGQVPEGETRDQLAHGCDWLPTIADYCGARLPAQPIDGLSLRPVLASANAGTPHREVHWQVGRGAAAQWAVRRDRWKLIGHPRETVTGDRKAPANAEGLFLSDLVDDVGEAKNHAADHPDVVRDLRELHKVWLGSVEGP